MKSSLTASDLNSRGGTRTRDPGIMSAGTASGQPRPSSNNSAQDVAESGGFLPPFTAKDTAEIDGVGRVAREFATLQRHVSRTWQS
jgi:hypothetical protein